MSSHIIIKLGGSIISNKRRGRPRLQTALLRRLGRELATILSARPWLRLILLHGAGSFGHPLAYRHHLTSGPFNKRKLRAVAATVTAMRELGSAIANVLFAAGLAVVPLQTSAIARHKRGRLQITNFAIVESLLAGQGIPLLNGDVTINDRQHTQIISADALAVSFARALGASRLIFLTNVDGVYRRFPPRRSEQPLTVMTRAELKHLIKGLTTTVYRHDVTGGMIGKLKELTVLRRCQVIICNGNVPKNLRRALLGEKVGTRIRT